MSIIDKFDNKLELNNRISIIIPEGTLQNYYKLAFMEMLSRICGGATEFPINGYFVLENQELAKEGNIMVFSYYSTMNDQDIQEIYNLIITMKCKMNQECIGLEENGKFYLV